MTLEELVQNITIQGNVLVSVWRNSDEISVNCIEGTECLMNEKVIQPMLGYEVLYMFSMPDGYLHIELASPEERR